LGLQINSGRFISVRDIEERNLVCVLGSSLSSKLGKQGAVGSFIRIYDQLFRVVGVLSRNDERNGGQGKIRTENFNGTLFLPLNILKISSATFNPNTTDSPLTQVIVEVDKKDQVETVAKLISRTLEITHNNVQDYSIIVPLELLSQSLATQRTFNLVLAVIGGISLLVGGIGIMNIMLATVTERKHEIGIRRAVGATQNNIVSQFLTESFMLTLCGGLLGLVAGLVCISVIESLAGWPIRITFLSMFLPFVLACITGILSGIYPAINAARIDPILALRAV